MEGLAYLLVIAVSLVVLATRVRRHFRIPFPRKIKIGLLITGCVAWAGGAVNLLNPPLGPSCFFSQHVGEPLGMAVKCKGPESRMASNPSDNASGPRASGQAFAYAAHDAVPNDSNQLGLLRETDRLTAVYDIAAHTVYLPNGTQLEAHSGFGVRLDDPRYVHEHMRGATPPNTYELILREKPFHGVRALRLIPVGNGNIFGRKGLLAHTYMLGPKGDSNGCVVFKEYQAFLQAFESGEVRRLLVVAHLD